MASEIFRLAAIRPPQLVDTESIKERIIAVDADTHSSLVARLKKDRHKVSRDVLIQFVKNAKALAFLDKVDDTYLMLARQVANHADQPFTKYFENECKAIFAPFTKTIVAIPLSIAT